MKHRRGFKSRANRRGGALAASLVVVTAVAGLGAALVQVHVARTSQQMAAIDTSRALYLAEAGLAEAFLAVAHGKSGAVADPEQPARFGDGVYWVEAQDTADNRVALESTGLCGAGRYSISLVLQRQVNSVAQLGVFGGESLTVGPGSILDAYDSREDPQVGDQDARVNSNGDIVLEDNVSGATHIQGSARPGAGDAITLGAGVTISGTTSPNDQDAELPDIEVPAVASSGTLVHADVAPLTLGPGELAYDSLRVEGGAKLTLEGPSTLVIGHLTLESGAELEFDTQNGTIELHATDELHFLSGSTLSNLAANPERVALLISAPAPVPDASTPDTLPPPTVELGAEGVFYGIIYAPNVELEIPGDLRVYGSVASDRLRLGEGARVSFDEALITSGLGIVGVPRQVSWEVVELPDEPIVRSRLDPLGQLRMRGVRPRRSYRAHLEQHLQVVYRSTSGTARVFTGPLETFDWSNVTHVRSVGWIRPGDWDPALEGDELHDPGNNDDFCPM